MIKCPVCKRDSITRAIMATDDPSVCLRWHYCKLCDRRWQTIECSLTEDALTKAYKLATRKKRAAA